MGQQPNIKIGLEDLPRPTAHPAPPRRWQPQRPGEIGAPDDAPWGGAFGTTGPDTGYALKLLADRDLPTGPGESHHSLEVALAALMGARASHFGRAPVVGDAEAAEAILGVGSTDSGFLARRLAAVAGIGHDKARARALVAAVDRETLIAAPADLRRRAAAGEQLIEI